MFESFESGSRLAQGYGNSYPSDSKDSFRWSEMRRAFLRGRLDDYLDSAEI